MSTTTTEKRKKQRYVHCKCIKMTYGNEKHAKRGKSKFTI